MPSIARTLQVPRTAHIQQLGELSAQTQDVWLACHGYGQLAQYFIRHFEGLVDNHTAVLAPEGLSHFYLQGFSGRVGATWMTQHERLSEIQDYITYLNLLREQIMTEAPQARLHVLGFSQGGATVCRWLAQATWPVAELILWAGVFPEDMELHNLQPVLGHSRITYVYGLEDEFVSDDRVQEQLRRVQAAGLHPQVLTFPGKHMLNAQVLQQLKGEHP